MFVIARSLVWTLIAMNCAVIPWAISEACKEARKHCTTLIALSYSAASV
jgi:hypothetical protein